MAEVLDFEGTEQIIAQTAEQINKKQDRLKEAVVQTMELITAAEMEAEQGRAMIAEALTGIGIPTEADASFEQMAQNIQNLDFGFAAAAKSHPDIIGAAIDVHDGADAIFYVYIETADKRADHTEEELREYNEHILRKLDKIAGTYVDDAYLNGFNSITPTFATQDATYVNVNINVYVLAADGYTFDEAKADAENAFHKFFRQSRIGKGVTLAELGNLLFSVPSVKNYRFMLPASDMAARVAVIPQLGNMVIRDMGA